MIPSIGRIVHFVLDEITAAQLGGNHLWNDGGTPKINPSSRVAAAMIVAVWGDNGCVNLKVFGDSDRDVWVTSVSYDPNDVALKPRTWHWPPKI